MDILTRLLDLRRREHLCTVDLLEALLDCDRTRAFLDLGYESMWRFLVDAMRYSNAAASRRHKAMKCACKFPVVLEWLRSESVTLCSLEAIAPLLDEFGDAQALLDRIEGKSQAEVQRIVAQARPVDERRETVRREFVKKKAVAPTALFETQSEVAAQDAPTSLPTPLPPPTAPQVEERVRVTLSLTPEEFELLERARMLASRRPGRTPSVHETVVEAARFYVEKKAPKERETKTSKKRAASASVEKPNDQGASTPSSEPTKRSRHIPVAIRDAVFLRDGGRCSFVGPTGHRCEATHDLHIDHIEPFASGGAHALGNLRVLCGAHNGRLADLEFGGLDADGVAVGTRRSSVRE